MANCCNMKEGDLYNCEACGLELEVKKTCACTLGSEDACSVPLMCVNWDDPENPMVLFNLVGQWIDLDVHFKREASLLETRLVFMGKPGWDKRKQAERRSNASLLLS